MRHGAQPCLARAMSAPLSCGTPAGTGARPAARAGNLPPAAGPAVSLQATAGAGGRPGNAPDAPDAPDAARAAPSSPQGPGGAPDGSRLRSPAILPPPASDPRRGAAALPLLAAPAALPSPSPAAPVVDRRRRAVAALATAGLLVPLWAGLTGGGAESWLFGAPAVLVGAALAWRLAPATGWRLSLPGALVLAAWFALRALRGALEVAGRALHPRATVAPGWHRQPLQLPPGAPRLVMAYAVTLLPGTLTAELQDEALVVHVLDTRSDPAAELAALEARVRALFALPPLPPLPPLTPETRP